MTTKYIQVQIKEGTAYLQADLKFDQNENKYLPFKLADFVLDSDYRVVKSNHRLDRVFETYLIVQSSPILKFLVKLYGKVFNKISRG